MPIRPNQVMYDRLVRRYGHWVELVRPNPGGVDVSVRVKVTQRYIEEEPLVHETSQVKTSFWLRISDLEEAGFPLPPRKNDRIVEDNVSYTIFVSEPLWGRGGTRLGYKVRCIGG